MKKKVLVCGCNGHMGRIVCDLISQTDDMVVCCGYDMIEDFTGPFPICNSIESLISIKETADIIIDFSSPKATNDILKFALLSHTPIVIATTGLSEVTLENISNASKDIPVFQSANMSVQVNLVKHVLETIAKAIPNADVEITETHHNRKKDAPSGTANVFAKAIAKALEEVKGYPYDIIYGREGKRKENEIGVSAIRGANIVGTHTVGFYSPFETLEITHTAHSRELFAEGAIFAARFLLDKEKGLYNMDDLL